jgi:hypothetical protein
MNKKEAAEMHTQRIPSAFACCGPNRPWDKRERQQKHSDSVIQAAALLHRHRSGLSYVSHGYLYENFK